MLRKVKHYIMSDVIIACLALRKSPGTYGTPPILVEKDAQCPDCSQRHDMEKCPKCGSWIGFGFGLMGGGYGPYKFCQADNCNWLWQEVLADDEA
jgi:hypothetical protein